MTENFLLFKKFNEEEQALDLIDLLKEHQIAYLLIKDSSEMNHFLQTQNPLSQEYIIKIQSKDFTLVHDLLLKEASSYLADIPSDYYLFSFSSQKLREIIAKQDLWSPIDFLLAQKILAERGEGVSPNEVKALQIQRLVELGKAEKSEKIVTSYTSFVDNFGLLSAVSAWDIATSTKTLPNGQQVYTYTQTDREKAKSFLVIYGVVLVLSIVGLLATIILI